jgi:hypothetical protein
MRQAIAEASRQTGPGSLLFLVCAEKRSRVRPGILAPLFPLTDLLHSNQEMRGKDPQPKQQRNDNGVSSCAASAHYLPSTRARHRSGPQNFAYGLIRNGVRLAVNPIPCSHFLHKSHRCQTLSVTDPDPRRIARRLGCSPTTARLSTRRSRPGQYQSDVRRRRLPRASTRPPTPGPCSANSGMAKPPPNDTNAECTL